MTYKWLAATVASGVVAIGGMWMDLREDMGSIQTDVAVIKYQIAHPSAAIEFDGQRQIQVTFVELPPSEAEVRQEVHGELTREILAQKGLVTDAATQRTVQ